MAAPPSVLTGRSRGVAHGGMNLVESVPGAVKSRPISYECPNIFPYLPRSPHRVISSGSHCGARRDGTPGPGAVLLHPPTNSDGARRHRGSRVPRAWQQPASADTIQARADTRGVHGCALSETAFPWPWSSAVAANAPSRIAYGVPQLRPTIDTVTEEAIQSPCRTVSVLLPELTADRHSNRYTCTASLAKLSFNTPAFTATCRSSNSTSALLVFIPSTAIVASIASAAGLTAIR